MLDTFSFRRIDDVLAVLFLGRLSDGLIALVLSEQAPDYGTEERRFSGYSERNY